LVERHGAEAVWEAGMDALGFPPSWNIGVTDATKIDTVLRRRTDDL
jgi:hypothetical protein